MTNGKSLNSGSYIQLYNMSKTTLHSPTLDSIRMVEQTIKESENDLGSYQLWKTLPKKMMYQTFQIILEYLEESGKILKTKHNKIVWTYNPSLVKKILQEGVKLR